QQRDSIEGNRVSCVRCAIQVQNNRHAIGDSGSILLAINRAEGAHNLEVVGSISTIDLESSVQVSNRSVSGRFDSDYLGANAHNGRRNTILNLQRARACSCNLNLNSHCRGLGTIGRSDL
ncbi:Sporulation initiation factor Spo0A C-terminal domain-containing protein, partial [Dysosmobacter welbionis]